ncbi:MAG: hypothetical protein HWD59_08250 [Coxiellaceae bacterium]|nr:MAG: hypothetical protein HWD59_08250 [Coxiellaceae bacterium]
MTRFLKPHIQKEIFNPDGTLNEKDCQKDGQRWVKALHAEQNDQLDETIAYVKFPELPGMQMAAETIADRISNQGARSTLLRCLHPQKKLAYPLLFSQPAGKTLLNIQRESSNLNTFEATLSPYNYTLKIFESIFIRSGDGKASNIAAIKRHSNETSLIHFDAEQCFNSELIKNDLLGEKLNLKDLVFALNHLKKEN